MQQLAHIRQGDSDANIAGTERLLLMSATSQGPSIASVARALSLSAATVSNAYNRPEKLSPLQRARILDYARSVGYAGPNPVARQLSKGRTDTVGLVFVDELRYAFHRSLVGFLEGLTEVCEGSGYGLLIIPTGVEADDRRITKITSAAVDALVVYSPSDHDPRLDAALARKQPVVIVEGPRRPQTSWVGLDDAAAAGGLTRHLLELGHRRIGVVTLRLHAEFGGGPVVDDEWNEAIYRVPRERLRGIIETLRDFDEPTSHFVYECRESTVAAGAHATDTLMAHHPDVTAVMALDDVLSFGVLDSAAAASRTVPDDLSVTGFDDVAEAAWRNLTTVRQPIHEKGRVTGRLVMNGLAAGSGSPEAVILPAELTIRGSTAPAPRSTRNRCVP